MSRAGIILLLLLSLLACKKRRADPTPIPAVTTPSTATATDPSPAADTWSTFTSEAGNFDVKSPESMKEETTSEDTAAGKLSTHMFTAKSGTTVYQVGYTDMPKNLVSAANAPKVLKGSEDGALKAINGTADTSKAITIQKYPAREFSTTATSQGIEIDYLGRVCLVKNRLFSIQVLAPKGTATESDRRKFIDSFHVR